MAQGEIKQKAKAAAAKNKSKVKKGRSAKADKIQKKYTAGMTARTEKLLGERVGHLELIGKGKKAPKDVPKTKGGSRKFG